MAEVQEGNNASGIKLFGATISIKDRSETDDDRDRGSREGKEDRTAEKRPEKIIPCPRCKSMETKFCYFNNYNVNQPRHFCRGCQRYWTAGGALRNVPVGAGRRKNKPPCGELSEGSLYDSPPGRQQMEFDGAEEWRRAAEHGGFEELSPAKRRRCAADSQTC